MEPKRRKEISAKVIRRHIDRLKELEVPIEQKLSKEDLARLHRNIHFTHQAMSKESLEKIDWGNE